MSATSESQNQRQKDKDESAGESENKQKNSPGSASMNALAGATTSAGDTDTDRPIAATTAPFARKERRLWVGTCSTSSLEEEAETTEERRRDGRATTAGVDAIVLGDGNGADDLEGACLSEEAISLRCFSSSRSRYSENEDGVEQFALVIDAVRKTREGHKEKEKV